MPDTTTTGVTRRRVLSTASTAIAATTALSGCSSGSNQPTTTYPGPVVDVGPNGDYAFRPGTDTPITVQRDTTVTFVWRSNNHNIVVGSQPQNANWQGTTGDRYTTYNEGHVHQHTFTTPGDYHFWCQPHKQLGMVGDLVVEE
ncbi:plastocyanin/azurin family copper-binding protein [Salarchaeum sp. JOR-1]|uniref:plastocyanin/azurin family copper-binding protein n=1 Tax=Salarchaeum sp. JOR-1 TaxID=2599399 RepID=UPI001198A177|nr:plastocyanin/azurin family copper-binding protein [Salarchaeum sp. JOR-1]QDX40040.1 plasmid stabilization protein [Salarchaeum sp. JOR-1]